MSSFDKVHKSNLNDGWFFKESLNASTSGLDILTSFRSVPDTQLKINMGSFSHTVPPENGYEFLIYILGKDGKAVNFYLFTSVIEVK